MINKIHKILLADDDIEDLELIGETILSLRPETDLHTVASGKAVIDYLGQLTTNELPELIILDYNMPELNGSQVLSEIKHPPYDGIPKVILSTSNAQQYMYECKMNGAAEYFVKPNTLSGLNEVVEKILAFCATGR
ncbi:MAG: response regulator [Bacteroidetes bacterium]|nr:response regulator [Bacteroidota bacterium]